MKKIISLLLLICVIFLPACSQATPAVVGEYVEMTGLKEAFGALIHKKDIVSAEYTGTPSGETWNASDEYTLENTVVLEKKKDKDFVILNITDPHFSDYDIRAFMAFPASSTIKRLVKEVQPDLITVTGDIVCGDSTEYSIKRFTDLMNSFGIPWAPVFGNHDAEANCDYNYLAETMQKSPYCVMKKGDPKLGCGNYIINIAYRDGESTQTVHSLIMADTGRSHLSENQIEWYKWAANGISELSGHEVESTVMFHIPCAEDHYAYDAAGDAGSKVWREGFDARGTLNEKICCPRDEDGAPVNNGFFAAVKEVGSTENIICGHEHLNDFSIMYEGVRLTYTLKVGMGSGSKSGMNGGTKITVSDTGLSIEHLYR